MFANCDLLARDKWTRRRLRLYSWGWTGTLANRPWVSALFYVAMLWLYGAEISTAHAADSTGIWSWGRSVVDSASSKAKSAGDILDGVILDAKVLADRVNTDNLISMSEKNRDVIVSTFVETSAKAIFYTSEISSAVGDLYPQFLEGASAAALEFWETQARDAEAIGKYLTYYIKKLAVTNPGKFLSYEQYRRSVDKTSWVMDFVTHHIAELFKNPGDVTHIDVNSILSLLSQEFWQELFDADIADLMYEVDSIYFERFSSDVYDIRKLHAFRAGFVLTERYLAALEESVTAVGTAVVGVGVAGAVGRAAQTIRRAHRKIAISMKSWNTLRAKKIDVMIGDIIPAARRAAWVIKAHRSKPFRHGIVKELLDLDQYGVGRKIYYVPHGDADVYISHGPHETAGKMQLFVFSDTWIPRSLYNHEIVSREFASDIDEYGGLVLYDWLISALSRYAEEQSGWQKRRTADVRYALLVGRVPMEVRHVSIDVVSGDLLVRQIAPASHRIINQTIHSPNSFAMLRNRFCLERAEGCSF